MADVPGAASHAGAPGPDPAAAKAQMRAQLLAARRTRTAAERERAAATLADRARQLVTCRGARRIACYVSFGTEPPTHRLLEVLAMDGCELVVPVVRADLDLDWTSWPAQAPGPTTPASQPAGPGRLATIGEVELVFAPALAVSTTGARLGRGAGSYDRALTRVPPDVPVVAIVYDEEIVAQLPTQAHDRPVQAALTPTRLVRLAQRDR